MDLDRRIIESLRKLQYMDNLTEEEFYQKKTALMRKLTAKATKFLYENERNSMMDTKNESQSSLQGGRRLFDKTDPEIKRKLTNAKLNKRSTQRMDSSAIRRGS